MAQTASAHQSGAAHMAAHTAAHSAARLPVAGPRARWRQAVAAAGLLFTSLAAQADNYQGTVSHVWAWQGKVYAIVANGAFDGGSGACPWSATSMGFAMDPASPYGRALIAIALSAKTTGWLIYISGDGVCAPGPGGQAEGVSHMDFKG